MDTVLVVDDNLDVAKYTAMGLEALGQPARGVVAAEHAIRELGTDPSIAFVVADWKMPDVNGDELLTTVQTLYPLVGVALMTAYPIPPQQLTQWCFPVLRKPFKLQELASLCSKYTAPS